MSPLIGIPEHIGRARKVHGLYPMLPWGSFADLFKARVYDPALVNRTFLIYCDDDLALRYTYSYAEFGTAVELVARFLHEQVGLRRGDRLATILFNHDVTVVLYFAAWLVGVTIVPINVEESADKKRYILEHSEASAVCCWRSFLEEVQDIQRDLPALRHVIAMNDEGFIEGPKLRTRTEIETPSSWAPTFHSPCLDDEALIVYTSGTTGPPKGVVLTVENLLIDADAISCWHRFGSDDRLMCVLPIHHVNGMVVTLMTSFYCKGSVVLNRKFKSATF